MAKKKLKDKRGFLAKVRRLLVSVCACAGVTLAIGLARGVLLMENDPLAIPTSVFAVGGGEVVPTHVGFQLVSSMGTTGVNRMEAGSLVMGTGIVGAISPSEANLDNAHAFPVPFMPSQGHTRITFSNITTRATIRIYTLMGEEVKEIVKSDPTTDRASWFPVHNEQGQSVASGVYHFVIEAEDGQSKLGKLMIIK